MPCPTARRLVGNDVLNDLIRGWDLAKFENLFILVAEYNRLANPIIMGVVVAAEIPPKKSPLGSLSEDPKVENSVFTTNLLRRASLQHGLWLEDMIYVCLRTSEGARSLSYLFRGI